MNTKVVGVKKVVGVNQRGTGANPFRVNTEIEFTTKAKGMWLGSFSDIAPWSDITEFRSVSWAPTVEEGYSALSSQVSGDHYKKLKIQPIEYIHGNSIPFAEGCVIKYVSRWRDKGGVKDLEKAKHFIELLIELESKNAIHPNGN